MEGPAGKNFGRRRRQANFLTHPWGVHPHPIQKPVPTYDANFIKHKCDQCEKSFTQRSGLKNHLNFVHKKLRLFKCEKCDKSFANLAILNQHVKKIHENKSFACDECTNVFKSVPLLKAHIANIHQGYKKYHCDICDKGIFDKKELTWHQTSKEHLENVMKMANESKELRCLALPKMRPECPECP